MEKVLQELKQEIDDFKGKQAEAVDEIRNLVKESEKTTDAGVKDAIAKAEKAVEQVTSTADRLLQIEQDIVAGVHRQQLAPKTLGALVVESDDYKRFASGALQSLSIKCPDPVAKMPYDPRMNTITGQTGSPAENSDIIVPADRLPGIVPGAFRRLRVADLIPSIPTTSNAVEVTRETGYTNNAAETSEGQQKNESDITFELYSTPVRTIAHFIKVSTQVREDAPMLMGYIDTRMRYGVELREDTQLVQGDGTNPNLVGMNHADNMTAFSPVTNDNALDTINRQKYAIDAADYMATGVIINPVDWGKIERTKVGASDDRYVIGDPRSAIGPFLWGLPVVVSNAMPTGQVLVAAFDIAFMLHRRSDTEVRIFEQDDTNAQKNLLTIRAEKRCALGGQRPASVRYGALTV